MASPNIHRRGMIHCKAARFRFMLWRDQLSKGGVLTMETIRYYEQLDGNGAVTLPEKIREALKLEPNCTVLIELQPEGNLIRIKPAFDGTAAQEAEDSFKEVNTRMLVELAHPREHPEDNIRNLPKPLTTLQAWLKEECGKLSSVDSAFRTFIPDIFHSLVHTGDELIWHYDDQEEAFIVSKQAIFIRPVLETDELSFYLRVVKHPATIASLLSSTTEMPVKYPLLLDFYHRRERLGLAELAGVLLKLHGQPDCFYDPWKCSFNYTFEFAASFSDSPIKEVSLIMRLQDYKGHADIQFRRYNGVKPDEYEPIYDYLGKIQIMLQNYYYGFFAGYDNLYPEFARKQPYIKCNYGYENGSFFLLDAEQAN